MKIIFLLFSCQKKQILCTAEKYFSMNASFWVVETDFLANAETPAGERFIFCLAETYFSMNPSLGFFSLMDIVTLLESFFLLAETVTAMSGDQFLKTKRILAGGILASGNHFLSLSHIFFKESFIPVSGDAFFSPKE